MGATDRRWITHLSYCFFRLGKTMVSLPIEERLLSGLFLCSDKPNEILQQLKPDWSDKSGLAVGDKCSIINNQCSILKVFPWKDEISVGIDHEKFCESFFDQPDLFLRIRPGKQSIVEQKLEKAGIEYRKSSELSIAVANSSKIDTVLALDSEVVVQDLNSQRVGEMLTKIRPGTGDRVWDCCAGSGGKTIMLYDQFPGVSLTVSDIRESIMINLKKRFKNAGINKYYSFTADLAKYQIPDNKFQIPNSPFSLIITDVPCTGSGTWGRTPEQLYYFDESKIEDFAGLQKKIVTNVIPHLQAGGHLLYSTCSVFNKENEEVVQYITNEFKLELVSMEMLKGYDKKADTMFAALLKKP